MPNDQSATVPFLRPTDQFPFQEHPSPELDFDSLLNDSERVRLLYYLASRYTRLFDTAKNFCVRLLDYHEVHYLLDFDVIRNYIEMRSFDKFDTFAVDFFFIHSKTKYSIPFGAFQELLAYLNTLTHTARLDIQKKDCEPIEAARIVARALRIEGADELRATDLSDAIGEALDRTIVQLFRLLSLLTSDRFDGITSDHTHDHYAAWLSALGQIPRLRRRPGTPRTNVDERDAINLGIASRSMVRSSGRTCYLLLSQTGVVLNLLDEIDNKQWTGLEDAFDLDRETIRFMHPAIHPRHAMLLELLGAMKDPRTALTRAESYDETFRKLGDRLRAEIVEARDPQDLYLKGLGAYIIERRRQTRELLKRAAEGVLNERDELRRIEDVRAVSDSIEFARSRARSSLETRLDPLQGRSLFFRRLLGQVAESLGVRRGVAYRGSVITPDQRTPFARIEIHRLGEEEPVMFGELYPLPGNHTNGMPYAYYVIRWPVACLEEQFFAALQSTWTANGASHNTDTSLRLKQVELHDPLWDEGVIVSLRQADYGLTLAAARQDGSWEPLRLAALAKLISEQVEGQFAPDGSKLVPEVQQIRVNTFFGDLLYDPVARPGLLAPPGLARRYVTVISDRNLALQITDLYAQTGQGFCIPKKLHEVLSDSLRDFPHCPR